jgi:hypothetical protein
MYPRISLITPVYNGSRFLDATLRSVLDQHYPDLDYIVVDGNSTDGTQDIIRNYQSRLTTWISEPDTGMYDALQKGFDRSTGEIMGWLNSDDLHLPWTLATVSQIFRDLPEVEWITSLRPIIWDTSGAAVDCMAVPPFSRSAFRDGAYTPGHPNFIETIQQESTFWRRSLWERAGNRLDPSLRYAGDFELWARFYHHAELIGVRTVLGGFRVHGAQLTAQHGAAYANEVFNVFRSNVPHPPAGGSIRRLLRPYLGTNTRRLLSRVSLAHAARIAYYDLANGRWQIRREFA